MRHRATSLALGLLVIGIGARLAQGQAGETYITGPASAGVNQYRVDTHPGVAGYQTCRLVPGGMFTVDVWILNIPPNPMVHYIYFDAHFDSTVVGFVGVANCLSGAGDFCTSQVLDANTVRIGTGKMGCAGVSGTQLVASLTFTTVSNGSTGIDISSVDTAPPSLAFNPTNCTFPNLVTDASLASSVVVVGAAPITCLNVNNAGNMPVGPIREALRNPNTSGILGIAVVTMRSSFQIANSDAGVLDHVSFRIPGPPLILNPMNPPLTDAIGAWIDGTAQSPEARGPGAGGFGIDLASGNNTLQLLTINGFNMAGSAGVRINGSNNVIKGCKIGVNPAATAAIANAAGVIVTGGSNNQVGIAGAANQNIISGNAGAGIEINGAASNTLVQNNLIGINAANLVLPNGTRGVLINNRPNNTVGGLNATLMNIISGNAGEGVTITGAVAIGNVVQGNRIGTTVNGLAARANAGGGVLISAAGSNTIGGTAAGALNLISGNITSGVEILNCSFTSTVQGNYIGTDATGLAPLDNTQQGVLINASSNQQIGGNTAAARNIISGNGTDGVEIAGAAASFNTVQGNYIGLDKNGALVVRNRWDGVYINGAPDNMIGGAVSSQGNVISGNGTLGTVGHGIDIILAASSNNVVWNNRIGTDASGMNARPNTDDGVALLGGAHDNMIGGSNAGNLISGNGVALHAGGSGVNINASNANLVMANVIGLNAAGTSALANRLSGVTITGAAKFNVVGGVLVNHRNFIAGNTLEGVDITGAGTDDNEVRTNVIGQSAGGLDFANGLNGVSINLAAKSSSIVGNSIHANTLNGVSITGAGTDQNDVLQNFIGAAAHSNRLDGVFIGGGAKLNLISANSIGNNGTGGVTPVGAGVHIDGAGTDGNIVTANNFLGNFTAGALISGGADNNVIGGDIPEAANVIDGNLEHGVRVLLGDRNSIRGNIIRNNNLSGVHVAAGTGNQVSRNSIFNNFAIGGMGGLGIDLDALGVTLNDPGDGDGGANGRQNFPEFASAIGGLVTGALHSLPNRDYSIEFFSNAACDASGHGEGQTFLGALAVNTNGAGDAMLNFIAGAAAGTVITATATDVTMFAGLPANNTSEFSQCIVMIAGPAPCPPDVTGNGVVDIDDLLAVIAAWGACPMPCPPACLGDLDGNCMVDIDDLLIVINAWGACP